MDIASTLGLSNTVMRLIERQSKGDMLILLFGIVVTLIIMWAAYHYLT